MKRLQYYSTSRHTCTFCPLLNQWLSLTAPVLYSTSRAPVTVTVTSHSTAHSTNYMRAPVHSTSALPGKFILPEWHIAFNISHMPKPIALSSQDRTWVFSHVWDETTTNMGLGMFKCELPLGAQGKKRKKTPSAYKKANTWLTAPWLLVGRLQPLQIPAMGRVIRTAVVQCKNKTLTYCTMHKNTGTKLSMCNYKCATVIYQRTKNTCCYQQLSEHIAAFAYVACPNKNLISCRKALSSCTFVPPRGPRLDRFWASSRFLLPLRSLVVSRGEPLLELSNEDLELRVSRRTSLRGRNLLSLSSSLPPIL